MDCVGTTTAPLPTCTATFAKGTSVTFTVTNSTDELANFASGSGDTCPTGTVEVSNGTGPGTGACTFTVAADVTLTAF
jgi:hypothetical protein